MRPRARGPGHPRNWWRLLGDVLLVAGVGGLVLAGFTYFTDPSRAGMSLPRPVALAGGPEASLVEPTVPAATETPEPTASRATDVPATAVPTAKPTAIATATPIPGGVPVRLVIESIGVDSEVKEIDTTYQNGRLVWETIPHIVGHYRTTAKAGQNGNAVFSGHVASRNWGNVFLDLYKIELGDEVRVFTESAVFTYSVNRVRLVLPTQTDVMNPTPDPTLTLITCGGDWLADRQDYSHRLVVSAKLKKAELR